MGAQFSFMPRNVGIVSIVVNVYIGTRSSPISMDWDVGFENLRALPKLTVFWETSAHESDAELQKTRDQGHF